MKKKILLIFTIFISLILIITFLFTYYMNYFNSVAASSTLEEYGDTYYLVESSDGVEVPVPYGYTASQIEGETAVETGFVIYEGDIDWSEIFDDEDTEISSVTSVQAKKEVSTSSLTEEGENTESNIIVTYEYSEDYLTCQVTLTSSYEITLIEVKEDDEYIEDTSFKIDEDNLTCTKTFNENISQTLKMTYLNGEEEEGETIEISITDILEDDTSLDETETEIIEEEAENTEELLSTASEEDIAVVDDETDDDDTDEEESTYYLSEYGYSEEESEAIWDLQCTTTQWVWIPVSEEDLSSIYGVDENGKYWGKLYSTTSKTTAVNWKESNGVMSITSSTNYREPDIATNLSLYDIDSTLTSYINGITRYELLRELEENYYKTIESIMEYGGFYVGRYETGDLNQTQASITKCNTNINSQTWYVMYEKCEGLARGNTNVRTSIIWDSLYDYIYRWFIDTGATKQDGTLLEESEIWSGTNGASRSCGNYAGSEFTYYVNWDTTVVKYSGQTKLYQTGISYYTAINNVFDLAGDVCDRTLCVYGTNYVVWRGDDCNSTSNDNYAAFRGSSGSGSIPTGSSTQIRVPCDTLS